MSGRPSISGPTKTTPKPSASVYQATEAWRSLIASRANIGMG